MTHPAHPGELPAIWRAVESAHIMPSQSELERYLEEGPWRVRVSERGDSMVLGTWREHLEVLAIRGISGSQHAAPMMVGDALMIAAARGYGQVVSPLVEDRRSDVYRAAGLTAERRLVVYSARCEDVVRAGAPHGGRIRDATRGDQPALVALEESCFDVFWRLGRPELEEMLRTGATLVADAYGGVAGYVSFALYGSSATITRLAVSPSARRAGIGRLLLRAAFERIRSGGSLGVTLCTQEENSPARRLYEQAGMRAIDGDHLLLLGDV